MGLQPNKIERAKEWFGMFVTPDLSVPMTLPVRPH